MRFTNFRHSRAGIAQAYLIAGAVAAAGLAGYFLYKHFKDKNAQMPPQYYQQQGYPQQQQGGYGGYQQAYVPPQKPYPQRGYYSQTIGTGQIPSQYIPSKYGYNGSSQQYGTGYYGTPREATSTDPELKRLWEAVQAAREAVTAAMARGDQAGMAYAQQVLTASQAALNARRQAGS